MVLCDVLIFKAVIPLPLMLGEGRSLVTFFKNMPEFEEEFSPQYPYPFLPDVTYLCDMERRYYSPMAHTYMILVNKKSVTSYSTLLLVHRVM